MSQDIFKANIPNPADFHSLTELTDYVDKRKVVKVGLLTALMQPEDSTHTQRAFIFDKEDATGQIPDSKSFSSRGNYITQDGQSEIPLTIPSMGWQLTVAPRDWANKRKPGSVEKQDEAYVLAKLAMKMDDGWDLHKEMGMATLLTTDQNYLGSNAIGTQYNFYTLIEGASRPTTVDVDFGGTGNPIIALRTAKKQLMQYAAKNGLSGRIVCPCGDTFFNSRLELEANAGLGRPIVVGKDLAQEEVGNMTNNSWNYDMFVGAQDGILYINYGSEILAGQNLIADNMAYPFLAGSGVFSTEYAPMEHRDYIGKEAETMYRLSYIDPFTGVRMLSESNRLYMNRKPGAVIRLTSTTA